MADLTVLNKVNDFVWELPEGYQTGMLVPARIYGARELIENMDEAVFAQAANVACLPGIVGYAHCMPDAHWGYGFPIGGVAAMSPERGVISPGGIGFDINCGMRLMVTNLTQSEVAPKIEQLVDRLFARVPTGVGCKGFVHVEKGEFLHLLETGAPWCLERGMGWKEDLAVTEDNGVAKGADARAVSERAIARGIDQIGTLGSGNHYLEIQVAHPENILEPTIAKQFGIHLPHQVAVMFHCGSRGFGHQVATDYLKLFLQVMQVKYDIPIRDRELACAPFRSPEGQDYFKAMKCAINMSFVNRQVIAHRVREVFAEVFGRSAKELGLHQVYDVAHNIAKLETHVINGKPQELLVHRKGATRALGPHAQDLPERYREIGQPVIIGGSMETGSYLLIGQASAAQTLFTTAHGSGRVMSRTKAKKLYRGQDLQRSMRAHGIYVRSGSWSGLAEEAGKAYKDINVVAAATEAAGISKRVVHLLPIGCIKG